MPGPVTKRVKHNDDPRCPSCEEKLKKVDARLAEWFWDLRGRYRNVHISCGYRGPEEQEKAFQEGKSKAHFPQSPHNKMPSKAVDLFLINEDGEAAWPPLWYAKVDRENKAAKLPIVCGIDFKSLGDANHFQLADPTK